MKLPEPQHMLGLRAMGKKGLDAYLKPSAFVKSLIKLRFNNTAGPPFTTPINEQAVNFLVIDYSKNDIKTLKIERGKDAVVPLI